MNLTQDVKVLRALNAVAAGTTSQNGSAIDTAGYDGVMFVAAIGTITATAVTGLKAQQDTVSGMGSAADLAGSLVSIPDSASNKLAILDVARPVERYVRPVVVRGTANAVIDGVIAILYKGNKRPSVHDATVVASKALNSPDEGTA